MLARTLLLLLSGLAVSAAAPACAQVLEIGDGGSVLRLDGPTLTTREGTRPLSPPPALLPAALLPAATSAIAPALVAPSHFPPPYLLHRTMPVGQLALVFAYAAREAGLDPRLLHAVAWQESRFRHDAVSPKGALGMMQLMPETARGLGVDPRDLIQNVTGGARLLAGLLRRFGGNLELALAAYNAGPDAVRRHGGIPPYRETRDYVRGIKTYLSL